MQECISRLIQFDPCADLPYRVLVARFIEIIARKCSEPSVKRVLIGSVPSESYEFGLSLPATHLKKYFVNATHCESLQIYGNMKPAFCLFQSSCCLPDFH